jgi:autotransporter-associated beta strand protein
MKHTRISNRTPPPRLERLEDRLAPAVAYWVGDTPTNNWKDRYFDLVGGQDTNWSDDLFPGGKSLVFDSSAVGHLSNNNDFPNVSVELLIFDGPGYTLTGNALNLTTAEGITVKTAAISATINLAINFDVSQTWVISSSLLMNGALSGAGGLTKAGAGTLTLSGTGTYAGPTVVEAGTLEIESATGDVIPGSLVINTTVILRSSNEISDAAPVTMAGGVFDLDGHNDTIGSLAGTGIVELADDPNSITADNARLTLGGDNTSTVFSGSINDDQVPSPSSPGGRLVKQGTGTFTLAGNNNYRGQTSVDAGTLLVNGSQPRSPIRVDSGATLGGTGVTGPIHFDGTLSPGNGPGNPGILTAQGDVFMHTSDPDKLAIDLNGVTAGAGYDQLKVLGTVTISSAIQVSVGFTPAIGYKFTIVDNDGNDAVIGTFAGWPEGGTQMVNGNLFRITYKGGDGNDVVLTRTTNFLVSAADAGVAARVRVFDAASKAQRFSFLPYGPKFKGGVHVAAADVNGDEFPDIITAPGPGTAGLVKVFSGAVAPGGTPQLLYQFKPYGNFKGGAFVAAGDVNGDRIPDIITGPGAGMTSTVKIFSGVNGAPIGGFSAFAGFKGGVTVAAGDVSGDGKLDIIAGMGPGAGNKSRIRIFDAASRAQIAGPLGNFLAYGANFKGGVFVAAGDVNGDTFADVITGPGAGMAPVVKVFTGDQPTAPRVLLAYPAGQKKGVRVAAGDVNGDKIAEIVAALGPGGRAEVRLFDNLSTAAIDSFFGEAVSFKKGLFVAG